MNIKKLNGNDYAWDILKRNAMDAHALLAAAHGQESVWLELKADPFCRRDCPNGPTDDAIWHTLKAVVAMVNTRGGCIVFGIADKTYDAVELFDDKINDLDELHRKVAAEFLGKTKLTVEGDKKDTVGRSVKDTHLSLSCSIERYCEFKAGVYRGKQVSFLLVRPSDGENFVWVDERKGHGPEVRKLYVRDSGHVGRVKYLEAEELRSWTRPKLDFDDEARDKFFDNMLSPVPEFVGRKDVLDRIEESFMWPDKWVVPLLYGPAGVGKSEIAYKFAVERNSNYETLIRVDASDYESFVDVFAGIANNPDFRRAFFSEGGHTDERKRGSEELFMSVREAIAEGRLGRVLIVMDDVRSPEVVRPSVINRYLGRICGPGLNIIATTRYPLLTFLDGEMVVPIEVRPLNSLEGVSILWRKRSFEKDDSSNAEDIVRLVGGNPWAIDIVGEYLKQKRLRGEDDYKQCVESLKHGLADFFPPKEHGTSLVGNATGVLDIGALLEPTFSAMQSEERDICSLVALAWKSNGPEMAFREAFERLYGRPLHGDEWRFYVETLKRKCLVEERECEGGSRELSLGDSIVADYFKSTTGGNRLQDAFLEFIRVNNRILRPDEKGARYYLDFVLGADVDNERKAEVVFDEERCGWPLYLMGLDARDMLRCVPNKDIIGPNEISAILKLAEGKSALEADVREIENYRGEGCTLENIHAALDLRKRIYSENPIMLGRSLMHAEDMGRGGLVDLEERIHLLEEAEAIFGKSGDSKARSRYLAEASRRLAEAVQEYVDHECKCTEEEMRKWRRKISACLQQAREAWPEIFDDLEESDIDIDLCIEEGVCSWLW